MNKVELDIKKAINIIDSNSSSIDRFEAIYPFATENVYGCFSNYNFQDKECLTVLGSSSQMLYMYINGAKNVTTFDINSLSVYYFYFIKAFILSKLQKEDLASLFINDNSKINKNIINTIIKKLKGEAYIFWKTLYNKYGLALFKSFKMFHYVDTPTIYYTSGYLDNDNLKEIRKIIKNIEPNFINCNIKNLSNYLDRQFDLIYLSNIIAYVDNIEMYGYLETKKQALIEYKKLIMDLSKQFLKEYGLLYAGYIYEPDDYHYSEPLYDYINRDKIFPKNIYYYHYFKGYNDIEYEVKTGKKRTKTDACIIYLKE